MVSGRGRRAQHQERVVVAGCAVESQAPAAEAAVDQNPVTLPAHRDRDRLQACRTLGLAIVDRRQEGDSYRFVFEVPAGYEAALATKGSVALDGVSLTVNEIVGRRFGVNIIPITQAKTTFGTAHIGDKVNIEIDVIARYIARILGRPLT